jgi:hypothetical protein
MLRRLAAYGRLVRRGRPDRSTADAYRALARRPALAAAILGYEVAVMASNRVDPRVKTLAMLKASSRAGCPF